MLADAVSNVSERTKPGRYCILGTAGHIDHGKSSLVKALTGVDPDRLPEEQSRGMTIELGFAHLTFAGDAGNGQSDVGGGEPVTVGIVDVPGHERFVRTMVAGATGIDLALLVVAADDGVMPQTREHIDILEMLGIDSGLIVMTKIDLVPGDRLAVVEEQIDDCLSDSDSPTRRAMQRWPRIACSARSGEGLDALRRQIYESVVHRPVRRRGDLFRMAIDRVFSIAGRGTVVTGSVLAGQVEAGMMLELLPTAEPCRVREAQSHGIKRDDIGAGQRAALNLTGVDKSKIARGMELATPEYLEPSRYVDAEARVSSRMVEGITSHRRVRVCIGTTEAMAMLVIIAGDRITAGQAGYVQLRFQQAIVSAYGQRFILRSETADATIGGGHVVRPVSRRFPPTHTDELRALERADAAEETMRFDEAARLAGFCRLGDRRMSARIGVEPREVGVLAEQARASGRTQSIGGIHVPVETIEAVLARAVAYLKRHHVNRPTEPGVPRDRVIGWIETRSAARLGRELYGRLITDGRIIERGPYVCDAGFRPALSDEDARLLDRLVQEIQAGEFDPPDWQGLTVLKGLSRQRIKLLEDLARSEPRLALIAPARYLSAESVAVLKAVVSRLGRLRPFKLAEVRDALSLNRRAVQPMLEYLDKIGFTRRVGDERILVNPAATEGGA